jgi:thioredoxin 1
MDNMNPVFIEFINSETPVLVQFHAEWCGPCKMLAPIVDAVAAQFEDQLRVLKVDIDRNKPITEYLEIRSVPTMMIFEKGEILWHHNGGIAPLELVKILKSFF